MPTCPACGESQPASQRFCGRCGAALGRTPDDTRTSPAPPPAAPTPRADGPPSGAGRFLPGTMLAGRYRMVGLLGRGGMGEVYRADDLKLGQPVALKFLPRDVERDPERLERFLTEVRMSLKVTHPNVCRVYDIAQADGRHFLSMEYVDGEDLASLLRRIGRLPEDKAVEIARQLCAGLQEAHDEGVLHRDLKPANVMLDGRGRAKITDFGLAGATEGIVGAEARAGTPQYMAPEQLAGHALTKQTDIYSLGLVLYELFTGKRAFEARNLQDLASLQRSTPTHPSTHVSGLNPVIERAILRCTDPDPARRPASAHALADALPGGDPLAMAIAAGETPSPEMVAHAGGAGTLRPLVAAACLATILAGLAGVWFASAHASLFRRVPLTLSPTELTAAARSAIAALGYPAPPVDVAYRYAVNGDQTGAIAKSDQSMNRWDQLSTAVPPPAYFWYRESPVPLVPANSVTRTGELDPPVTRAGMVSVRVDPAGHLWFFRAKPPSLDAGPERATEPDWQKPFSLAGLDPSSFAPADPRWTPPEPSDTRRAWVKGDLRIEAAAFRGRLVWFEVIPAWKVADTGAATPQTMGQRAGQAGAFAFVGGILLFAGFLARRNLRLGRGDSKGAVRLAALFSVLATMVDVLETSSSQAAFFGVVVNNLSLRLFTAGVIWLTYLAIEPYVRRLWPHALITWSRLLDGRLRDPLVGRDLLYGGVAGMVVVAVQLLPQAAPRLGLPPPVPVASGLVALHGTAAWMAAQFRPALSSFAVPVEILLGLLVFRVTFRKPWLAYGMFFLALGLVLGVSNPGILQAVSSFSIIVLATVIVTRLGLVAFMVAIAFSSWNTFPLTTDPASWYFPYSAMTMMLFAAVAVYGFVVAVGDRLRFKDSVLD